MSGQYRATVGRLLCSGFETRQGLPVIWQAICWQAMGEAQAHAMIRPLSTEIRASWAKRVLEARYPGRVYEVNHYLLGKAVEADQLAIFEGWALDEVGLIELADKYSARS